ncbi:MAG: HNH endonuclease [Chloroflexota bacterium]
MNYWIIRGRPTENKFDEMLIPNRDGNWRTARPPKEWHNGDRLFFWASSPIKAIIGFGELGKFAKEKNKEGDIRFEVRYLTNVFGNPVRIEELRKHSLTHQASFLKIGPTQTVMPLTQQQGEALYHLVISKNPGHSIWKDIPPESIFRELISQEQNSLAKKVFNPRNLKDARKRVMASIVRRQGQPQFRQELIQAYNSQCAITGYNAVDALEAAHIIQYLGPNTNHVTNGLLLRADIHVLFDLHLIAVNSSNMTVIISPSLENTSYSVLNRSSLLLPNNKHLRPNKKALDKHRKEAGL